MKVGLMPLYIKLYDDIDPKLKNPILPIISKIKKQMRGASVVVTGIVCTKKEAAKAAALLKRKKVQAVFTVHLAYSPSYASADALASLKVPIVMLDATISRTFKDMAPDFLMNNHGIHGVMDLSSVLTSKGVPFSVIAGHPDSKKFKVAMKNVLTSLPEAKRAAQEFKTQKVGISGKPFEMMGDFQVPFGRIKRDLGIKVVNVPLSMVRKISSGIPLAEVERTLALDSKKYKVSGGSRAELAASISVYLALKKIAAAEKLDAYSMSFLDFKGLPVPFYACNRLMEDGLGYGGEGDVLTAALGKPLNRLAGKAMFSEFFCPDWKRGLILMSHMGEIDPRFRAKRKAELRAKPAFGNTGISFYHRFEVRTGRMTFVNIGKTKGGYKIVTGLADIVKSKLYDVLDNPQFVIKPKKPLEKFLEDYASAGGGHHIYLAEGDILAKVELLGACLGMPVYKV